MKLKPQPGTDLLELKKLTKRMREMSPDDERRRNRSRSLRRRSRSSTRRRSRSSTRRRSRSSTRRRSEERRRRRRSSSRRRSCIEYENCLTKF